MPRLQLGDEERYSRVGLDSLVAVDGFYGLKTYHSRPKREEHKDHITKHRKKDDPFPPTPDFILKKQGDTSQEKCTD
jgi:hypothetical protein